MLLAIIALVCTILFLVLYVFFGAQESEKSRVDKRVRVAARSSISSTYVIDERERPLNERLFTPIFKGFSTLITAITPRHIKEELVKKLEQANDQMPLQQLLLRWGLIAFVVMTASVSLAKIILKTDQITVALVAIGAAIVGMILPMSYLNMKIANRQKKIRNALPDVIDLLLVSIQAGMPFDAAIEKIAAKMKGPLIEAFLRMNHQTRMGVPRRDALKDLAVFCQIEEMSLLTSALIQADQLGVSVAQVMFAQVESMRKKRLLIAREKGLQTPVKLVFPLVFFMLPVLFIVLMGPAVLTVMKTM